MKIIINNIEYPLVDAIFEKEKYSSANRDTALITMQKTHDEIATLFPDGTVWKIKTDDEQVEDYSDYSLSGKITDNRDGTSTIVMSKFTEIERLIEIIYGGVNNESDS